MRRFASGPPTDRKIVTVEVHGTTMSVFRLMPDGTTKRTEKELRTEQEAKAVSQQFASELMSRGYVEQETGQPRAASPPRPATTPRSNAPAAAASGPTGARSTTSRAPSRPRPAAADEDDDGPDLYALKDEEPAAAPEPVLARLAPRPAQDSVSDSSAKKGKLSGGQKKKKKKKKKKAGEPDALDRRVLALFGVVGAVLVAGLAYMAWDVFLRPATIVGTWRGSLTDYEVGSLVTHTSYDLILDEKHRASMTVQGDSTSVGTYSVKGNRLKLSLKAQKDDGTLEDEASDVEYKIALGSATLDLTDPQTGKLVVQLIRFREPPVIGETAGKSQKAEKQTSSANLAADLETIDKAKDEQLASVEFSPKDTAFKVRYPQGWQPDTGSRPDNTYSWASFTHDSARIDVRADVKGSLMSGSDAAFGAQFEEGSESAPVHRAHELYAKSSSEDFSEFKESKPEVLKGASLGEGRISQFTATESGLFGGKLWGYHATLLTRDRCVTILCRCSGKEFPNLKPTFLAVCRSLSR